MNEWLGVMSWCRNGGHSYTPVVWTEELGMGTYSFWHAPCCDGIRSDPPVCIRWLEEIVSR